MKNRTRNYPKIGQNRSKTYPKSAPGPTWPPGPFSDRFLSNFGSNLGPSWGPSWVQVGAMLAKKSIFGGSRRHAKTTNDFQHLSGPSWDRFWSDFGVQNRATIGLRSVSRAIMKQMQISSKSSAGAVFLRIRSIEKAIKNQQKLVLKSILS